MINYTSVVVTERIKHFSLEKFLVNTDLSILDQMLSYHLFNVLFHETIALFLISF